MGAAFAVALVLIYILVVWEFGNFRIPALIMAPIPLTLLGIIPAHFIFFQAGWGGEFTATSMIGWIALAGIIVRNSILLVDFSIHQVQQGVSVVDSVIMACKTRTRPIMITAFALVCGSSVIFFDPIFQGMAISLASGVLVSTVLTLIVIPLGCISASKDILEVAAATAPAGSESVLPQAETKSEVASQPVAAAEQQSGRERERTPTLAMMVWGKLVAVITMIFYLFKGIFLLFGQLFKGLSRKGKQTPSTEDSPKDPGSSGSSGGAAESGGVARDSGASLGGSQEPPNAAAPVTETKVAMAAEQSIASSEIERQTPPPKAQKDSPAQESAQETLTVETEGEKREASIEMEESPPMHPGVDKAANRTKAKGSKTAQRSAPTQAKQKKRASTVKKQITKRKASAAKKEHNRENEVEASADQDAKKKDSNITNFPIRKKSARRGIRLK
jgi:hypothetical protein